MGSADPSMYTPLLQPATATSHSRRPPDHHLATPSPPSSESAEDEAKSSGISSGSRRVLSSLISPLGPASLFRALMASASSVASSSIFRTVLTSFDRVEVPNRYPDVVVPLRKAHLHSHAARDRGDGHSSSGGSSSSSHRNGRGNDDHGHDDDDQDDDDDDDDDQDAKGRDPEPSEARGMLQPAAAAEYTIESLRREVRRGGRRGTRWTEYELKSKLVSKAIQDIGMGPYNWRLFILCGFGWFADNLWMQGVSLTLPSLSATFDVSEKAVRLTTSSLYLGLCLGSFFWGVTSDILGRRLAFNATLLITALFGLLAAFAPTWPAACAAFALLGFGVGGNLPVDGALFLEFLPDARSSLLTLLSVWWPAGQLVSSLAAWYCIGRWPAETGWRYFVLIIGIITLAMFAVRCFVFDLFESPKYLLSRGRQAEAVAVVQGVAHRNRVKTWLTSDILDAVADGAVAAVDVAGGGGAEGGDDGDHDHVGGGGGGGVAVVGNHSSSRVPSTAAVVRAKLTAFSGARLRPLFRHRTLGVATALVWFTWTAIGMGYPLFNAFLPQYLSHGHSPAPPPSPPSPSSSPSLLSSSSSSSFILSSSLLPSSSSSSPSASFSFALFSALSARFFSSVSDGGGITPISPATYRAYAIASLAGIPGSFLAAYLVDRPSPFLGRRGTLAISTLVSAIFLFLFAVLGTSAAAQLVVSCVEAFSQNIMYGVLYAFTPEIFPSPVRGAGTGVASFLNRVAGLAAPMVAAMAPGDGASTPVFISSALILAAFVGICMIPIETRGAQRL